jgi:hypothetical protein
MAECAAAQMRKAGAQQIEDIDAGWRKWSGHSGCSSLTPASAEQRAFAPGLRSGLDGHSISAPP